MLVLEQTFERGLRLWEGWSITGVGSPEHAAWKEWREANPELAEYVKIASRTFHAIQRGE